MSSARVAHCGMPSSPSSLGKSGEPVNEALLLLLAFSRYGVNAWGSVPIAAITVSSRALSSGLTMTNEKEEKVTSVQDGQGDEGAREGYTGATTGSRQTKHQRLMYL